MYLPITSDPLISHVLRLVWSLGYTVCDKCWVGIFKVLHVHEDHKNLWLSPVFVTKITLTIAFGDTVRSEGQTVRMPSNHSCVICLFCFHDSAILLPPSLGLELRPPRPPRDGEPGNMEGKGNSCWERCYIDGKSKCQFQENYHACTCGTQRKKWSGWLFEGKFSTNITGLTEESWRAKAPLNWKSLRYNCTGVFRGSWADWDALYV